jgi:hypothetical protein
VATVMIVLVGVAMWVNPAMLFWVWVSRMKTPDNSSIRNRIGWLSLVLASLAVLIFFGGMGFSPTPATQASDVWFVKWFRACLCLSVAAFLCGIAGRGRRQWAVALSAIITPLSCLLQKVLE